MLDLDRMRGIRLSGRPRVQRVLARLMLAPNYRLPPRVRLHVEGADQLPDEPVIYAMNHTDRYNYWPFQYWLYRSRQRFTATWVKGKYYENRWVARFMELTNNIPAVSRGYVLTRDFLATVGRRPTNDEYRAVRALCDGDHPAAARVPAVLLAQARDILGRRFDPAREPYARCVDELLAEMHRWFVALNERCFALGLDLLVFPQGTRSRRLSRGRIGLAQVALHTERPIVPVGCSGCDRVYRGASPWARGGDITYRIGAPVTRRELGAYALPASVAPFAREMAAPHRAILQGLVDDVMDRIDALVDPAYRYATDRDSDGVRGSSRFV